MIRADRMSASQQRSPYCSMYPLDLESDGLTSIPYRRRPLPIRLPAGANLTMMRTGGDG
jgi:hypothetical protein